MKNEINTIYRDRLLALDRLLEGQKKLLIILHNNPDPDALASAYALRYLVEKRHCMKANIAYGGLIGRAENRALVQELKIPLKNINRINFSNYDRVAIVDSQPGAGNNALPPSVDCHIVIDHHPKRRKLDAPFTMIDPTIGSTATIMVQLLIISELPIFTNMATALAYAIRSETQDLGRETSTVDILAYFAVYSKASMKKLSRITLPKLQHSYFLVLEKTLNKTKTFRQLISAHIGEVPTPEIVAEMADFLLRHERMSWAFCTGRYKDMLYMSLRTVSTKAKAGKLIKQLVPDKNFAGGHGTFAGGAIPLADLPFEEKSILEIRLSQKFAKLMGYENVEWKPLLEE